MDGPHSPFGLIWQIASATGWTPHYILWHVPYPMLILMAADAPRYVDADEAKRINNRKYRKNKKGQKAVDFFQTKLEEE